MENRLRKIALRKICSSPPTAVHEQSSSFSLYSFIFFFVSLLLSKSKAVTEKRLADISQCLASPACTFRELDHSVAPQPPFLRLSWCSISSTGKMIALLPVGQPHKLNIFSWILIHDS